MTNKEAIDILLNAAWLGTDNERERIEKAVDTAINALTKEAWKEEHPVLPLIQQKAQLSEKDTEKRTETHSCDYISRQAVLDWLKNEWNGMVTSLFDGIKALPSARPEIIQCKECVCAADDDYHHCPYVTWWNSDDDFCSKGKRRTDEADYRKE